MRLKIERESDRKEKMLTSISFLQSASASALASSQQLWMGPKLLTAASSSSSTQRVSPSLVIQAKAKTRREDRTARHIRIRKKVPTLFFSSYYSLRFEPQLLKNLCSILLHWRLQFLYALAMHTLCLRNCLNEMTD